MPVWTPWEARIFQIGGQSRSAAVRDCPKSVIACRSLPTPRCNVGHVIQGSSQPLSSVYVSYFQHCSMQRASAERGFVKQKCLKILIGTSFSSNRTIFRSIQHPNWAQVTSEAGGPGWCHDHRRANPNIRRPLLG